MKTLATISLAQVNVMDNSSGGENYYS